MVIIVSEVGKILLLICRSYVCRRSGKVHDLIFSSSLCWAHLHAGDAHGSVETHPSPLGEGEGIHFRPGHRVRKASLSDGVAVDRIAAIDRQEEFKGVTEELNREIQEHRHEANA